MPSCSGAPCSPTSCAPADPDLFPHDDAGADAALDAPPDLSGAVRGRGRRPGRRPDRHPRLRSRVGRDRPRCDGSGFRHPLTQRHHRVAAVRVPRDRPRRRRAGLGSAARPVAHPAAHSGPAPRRAVAARGAVARVRVRQRAALAGSHDARSHDSRGHDVPRRGADRQPGDDPHDVPGVRVRRRHPRRPA